LSQLVSGEALLVLEILLDLPLGWSILQILSWGPQKNPSWDWMSCELITQWWIWCNVCCDWAQNVIMMPQDTTTIISLYSDQWDVIQVRWGRVGTVQLKGPCYPQRTERGMSLDERHLSGLNIATDERTPLETHFIELSMPWPAITSIKLSSSQVAKGGSIPSVGTSLNAIPPTLVTGKSKLLV
jgi:hypothetical protein